MVINYTLETNTETCLDFESTHFQYNQISTGDCLKRVRLPESAKVLSSTDKVMDNVELKGPVSGLELSIRFAEDAERLPLFGTNELGGMLIFKMQEIDMKELLELYPDIHLLRIFGALTFVLNLKELTGFKHLKELYFEDVFWAVNETFPCLDEFQCLEELCLESIPKEAGQRIKGEFKEKFDRGF